MIRATSATVKAVAEPPSTATTSTNGETCIPSRVSGPSEPEAWYGFQEGLEPSRRIRAM